MTSSLQNYSKLQWQLRRKMAICRRTVSVSSILYLFQLYEKADVIQPVQGLENPTYPVIYNQHIYFLSSVDSRNKFTVDPRKYLDRRPQVKPVVPIQIAIVGPPKSGKTTCNFSAGLCNAE